MGRVLPALPTLSTLELGRPNEIMYVLVRLLIQLHVNPLHQKKDCISLPLLKLSVALEVLAIGMWAKVTCAPSRTCPPFVPFHCDGENAGVVVSHPGPWGRWQQDQRCLDFWRLLQQNKYTRLRLSCERDKFLSCLSPFHSAACGLFLSH